MFANQQLLEEIRNFGKANRVEEDEDENADYVRSYMYRVWNDLTPLPQPQLELSQQIYIYSIKISPISDSSVKFHEPELIFNAWNDYSKGRVWNQIIRQKYSFFQLKGQKYQLLQWKLCEKNLFYYQCSFVINYLKAKRCIKRVSLLKSVKN